MIISIIIPVYNEEKFILEVLKKVNQKNKKFNLEIIVCDDCSNDQTKNILLENKDFYDKILFNDINMGKGLHY